MSYGLLRIFMHLVRTGDIYGKSMIRGTNQCFIFLIYNIMHTFIYPQDYLSKKGSIQHCWEIHVKRMKEIWKPYVDYFSFYNRIKRRDWDLYRAIHTPLDYSKLEWHEITKVWLRTQWLRFIYLFKKDEECRWRKRSKGHFHSRKG